MGLLFGRFGLAVCVWIVDYICLHFVVIGLVLLVLLFVDLLVKFLFFEVFFWFVNYESLFGYQSYGLKVISSLVRGEVLRQVVVSKSIVFSHFTVLKVGQIELFNFWFFRFKFFRLFGLGGFFISFSVFLSFLIFLLLIILLLLLTIFFILFFLLLIPNLQIPLLFLLVLLVPIMIRNILQNRLGIFLIQNNLLPIGNLNRLLFL
jgi:hypothetical protein